MLQGNLDLLLRTPGSELAQHLREVYRKQYPESPLLREYEEAAASGKVDPSVELRKESVKHRIEQRERAIAMRDHGRSAPADRGPARPARAVAAEDSGADDASPLASRGPAPQSYDAPADEPEDDPTEAPMGGAYRAGRSRFAAGSGTSRPSFGRAASAPGGYGVGGGDVKMADALEVAAKEHETLRISQQRARNRALGFDEESAEADARDRARFRLPSTFSRLPPAPGRGAGSEELDVNVGAAGGAEEEAKAARDVLGDGVSLSEHDWQRHELWAAAPEAEQQATWDEVRARARQSPGGSDGSSWQQLRQRRREGAESSVGCRNATPQASPHSLTPSIHQQQQDERVTWEDLRRRRQSGEGPVLSSWDELRRRQRAGEGGGGGRWPAVGEEEEGEEEERAPAL